MFQKILVPVDGSEHSGRTLPAAVDLATKYGAEVVVLHVREHGRSWASDADFSPPEQAKSVVDEAVARFREAGLTASGEVRDAPIGEAPRVIVDAAEANGVELIVMGNRGMTQWRSLLLGSVAHKILEHANCAVLLVR
jgi:nucleotide-binding universal stress UspA family protein